MGVVDASVEFVEVELLVVTRCVNHDLKCIR